MERAPIDFLAADAARMEAHANRFEGEHPTYRRAANLGADDFVPEAMEGEALRHVAENLQNLVDAGEQFPANRNPEVLYSFIDAR